MVIPRASRSHIFFVSSILQLLKIAIDKRRYRPDYTARLLTPNAQLFCVSYAEYQEALNQEAKLGPSRPPPPVSCYELLLIVISYLYFDRIHRMLC